MQGTKARKLPGKVRDVCDLVLEQGWRLEETNKGFKFFSPCGNHIVCIHMTSSDCRAYQNIRQDFRKAGVRF
jgi:hypothetical protein